MTIGHQWSDYVVYVDESGDHSLRNIDPMYPVFVLAFCIFHKQHYAQSVTTALTKFKFRHFGHDMLVLHEHDIRKERNGFNFFNREAKLAFMTELGDLIEEHNFVIVSVAIDKQRLAEKYHRPNNPYHIALEFCLERLYYFLCEKEQHMLNTHIVVEKRGVKEDKDLKVEFSRLRESNKKCLPFELIFADKKANSSGLQLADLIARPIGLHIIRPEQHNKAFSILQKKFYSQYGREGAGKGYKGYGLKCFP